MCFSISTHLSLDKSFLKLFSCKTLKSVPKVWCRSLKLTSDLVGFSMKIYNGKDFIPLIITDDMVGYKLGEFIWTRARYQYKKKKKKKKK